MGKPIFRPNGPILDILCLKNPQKTTKMAISYFPSLPPIAITKKPKDLSISNRLIWNFQNQCKSRFRAYVQSRIFDLGLQKNLSPKSKKNPGFFGYWAQKFFGDLNQKSGSIHKREIYFYIDYENSRSNGWKLTDPWAFWPQFQIYGLGFVLPIIQVKIDEQTRSNGWKLTDPQAFQ